MQNLIYLKVDLLKFKLKNIKLKVPKHENFSIAFFALSEPIQVCDVGTAKKQNFYQFDGFGFFAAY